MTHADDRAQQPRVHVSLGPLFEAAGLAEFLNFFYDVCPNGFIVPLDALVVINALSDQPTSGDGEAGSYAAFVDPPSQYSSTLIDADTAGPRFLRPIAARSISDITSRPVLAGEFPADRQTSRRPAAARVNDLFADLSWLNDSASQKIGLTLRVRKCGFMIEVVSPTTSIMKRGQLSAPPTSRGA